MSSVHERGRSRSGRVLVWIAGVIALLAVAAIPFFSFLEKELGGSELHIIGVVLRKRLGILPDTEDTLTERVRQTAFSESAPASDQKIQLDESIVPFTNIGASLGDRGKTNNFLQGNGAVIFDANGDGRLDLYVVHSGRPAPKKTVDHILQQNEHVPAKPCTLFLNMGNDENGRPILTAVQDLIAKGNKTRVLEELISENKYRPRSSITESENGPGRAARGAAAADFNGDGRLDLYVANDHDGWSFQTEELGLKLYPSRDNIGREDRAKAKPVVLRAPGFLRRPLADGLKVTVNYGPKPEPEGRNSLFLNLGDTDGDGVPEWKDATDELGVGGKYSSQSVTVADIDRDGDLDIYVSNFLDPDYWGFGAKRFSGNRNELYVNQLAESGKLAFKESALDLGVAGLHDEEKLPATVFVPGTGKEIEIGDMTIDGEKIGEKADHSWAAQLVDWNEDGFPDLVVANDEGNRIRIYENKEGKRFERVTQFDEPHWDGCWMGISEADFDGDLHDELFVSNCGGQTMTANNTAVMMNDIPEPSVHALSVLNYTLGHSTLHHVILSFQPGKGLVDVTKQVSVTHSPYLPPDLSLQRNFSKQAMPLFERENYEHGLASYEFAWGSAILDVENDGDLDVYWAGGFARGNDGFLGDSLGSPGRLLANDGASGKIAFTDRTIEYRLLDITDMDYDHNPPRRPAPGTGWHKRDYIYLQDTDSYMEAGLTAAGSSAVKDLLRLHEAATGILSGDLNGDGYEDIVVTHQAGYNGNSPKSRNLKVDIAGKVLAVPPPNSIYRAPTSFEEGPTFVYINGGPKKGSSPNWVQLHLMDPSTKNTHGVGARVIANGRLMRRSSIGGATWSAASKDLTIGLGDEPLRTLEIHWPSGDREPQRISLDQPKTRERICVDRSRGVVRCPW
jgi:hypothetical protein